jgi:hypothetical protein
VRVSDASWVFKLPVTFGGPLPFLEEYLGPNLRARSMALHNHREVAPAGEYPQLADFRRRTGR